MSTRDILLDDVFSYNGSLIGLGDTLVASSFSGPTQEELVFDDTDDDSIYDPGEGGTLGGQAVTDTASGSVSAGIGIDVPLVGTVQLSAGSSVPVNVFETAGTSFAQYPEGDPAALLDNLVSQILDDPLLVTALGGVGNVVGFVEDNALLNFDLSGDIAIPVCFARGTRILTRRGSVPIEELRVGDDVITREHGYQAIRWIGSRTVPANGTYAPIWFATGSVGNATPLLVSPEHRILRTGWAVHVLTESNECLVAAKHLVDGETVRRRPGGMVQYYHLLFDMHEIIFANEALCESFHPGPMALCAVDAAARDEILALFPDLVEQAATGALTLARPVLRRHEARMMRRMENPPREMVHERQGAH